MSYTIKFTDFANKGSLTVNDGSVNDDTSILLPGRNYRGYGQAIAENFLHLLENFANSSSPDNPIEGQVWYDSNPGTEELKVYDGTQWKSVGSVRKALSEPAGIIGDLWVDTNNQQLYLYNGANWVLVGPVFSSGLRTGVQPETVLDVNNVQRVIIKTYVDDEIISIYSLSSFIPKLSIEGFASLKPGINLSTKNNDKKYWGTAEKAESLIIGTESVSSSNFLRKDTPNITNFNFSVRNDTGLNIGSESQLRISIDSSQTANIYNQTPDSSFDIRVNRSGNITTLIRADSSTGYVGIGENNLTPSEALDVKGSVRITDKLKIQSTENSINDVTGALQVLGGVNIQKDLIVRGNISLSDNLSLNGNITSLGNMTVQNITANSVTSNFIGNLTGNVIGNINGTAARLLSSTTFNIAGDIVSAGFSFDGQTGGLTKTFNTVISTDIIENKPELTSVSQDPLVEDYLLVQRSNVPGLRKIARRTFLDIPTVPVGAIFPYAGSVPPTGYLLCDGSEKLRAKYPDLFEIIGFTYGSVETLLGLSTFKVPDLRGRFPLGKDNMDNLDSVPNAADNGNTNIDAGGGSANRVTDSTADILGNGAGIEQRNINLENLPDHKHTLVGDQGTQFYTLNNSAGFPPDTGSFSGNGPDAAGQAQYIDSTGNIQTTVPLGVPVNIMNPYLTINYIIYAGRVL
jgi:microcystin-dependent protein